MKLPPLLSAGSDLRLKALTQRPAPRNRASLPPLVRSQLAAAPKGLSHEEFELMLAKYVGQ